MPFSTRRVARAHLHEVRAIPILRPLLLHYAPWPFIPFDELVRRGRGTLFVTLYETLQDFEGPLLMDWLMLTFGPAAMSCGGLPAVMVS